MNPVTRLSLLWSITCVMPVDAALGQRPADAARHDSAVRAFSHGLMALHSAGVDRFIKDHPAADGTGVLIAILDSGIDPGVPGLATTTHGSSKILDLRDFSGEGRIPLRRIERRGDTLVFASHRLLGASHVAAVSGNGALWGGVLVEARLGKAPAADLNGNGSIGDSLLVIVAKASDGWVVFADTRGVGTLSNETAVRDYALARESFGWHTRTPEGEDLPPPVNVAVNLADSAGTPILDLFFDTSSHGTHVAGIAAGHDLYAVAGFDGIAPGANVIGLKISDDAHGSVSVTGSMLRALDYAVRFARDRAMPLVVNLSFGVGNEVEGTARIDILIDSVLAAHPDVVMTVAAGNDGPGLSTIGFPGSASRIISVGATMPLVFLGADAADTSREPIASFSSRGGELAGPDLVVPGAAFSTVPRFASGEELETGTSMASPYAAGLAARLLSGLHAANRTVPAFMIRQALRATAVPLRSGGFADQGAGVPDLDAAWNWVFALHDVSNIAVDVGQVAGRGAIYLAAAPGAPTGPGLVTRVTLRRLDSTAPVTLRLRTDADWIHVPEIVALANGHAEFVVRVQPPIPPSPGVVSGLIRIEGPDEAAGSIAVVPVILRTAVAVASTRGPITMTQGPGTIGRLFVSADSGRGLQIEVATLRAADHVTAALHEPGGMPFRDGATVTAGFGDGAGLFDIVGGDVVAGLYELDVIAGPLAPITARVTVHSAPLRLGATLARDTLRVTARSLLPTSLSVRLRAGLIGAERRISVSPAGDAPIRIVVPVPSWASHVAVDTHMPRDQWSRFTDLGLSYYDRQGRELETTPINYAVSRSTPDLPQALAGDSLVIVLSPGFADPDDHATWTIDLSVRFYVATPYSLDGGGSSFRPVAGGALREDRFRPVPMPITLPGGFLPLITVVALEGTDHTWTRELVIAPWGPP